MYHHVRKITVYFYYYIGRKDVISTNSYKQCPLWCEILLQMFSTVGPLMIDNSH